MIVSVTEELFYLEKCIPFFDHLTQISQKFHRIHAAF